MILKTLIMLIRVFLYFFIVTSFKLTFANLGRISIIKPFWKRYRTHYRSGFNFITSKFSNTYFLFSKLSVNTISNSNSLSSYEIVFCEISLNLET